MSNERKSRHLSIADRKMIRTTRYRGSMKRLKGFIGENQLRAVYANIHGEEGQWFLDKLESLADRIENMPKTYEQDGKGKQAMIYLHYFRGGHDFYITEKDQENEQRQAFGLANLGYGAELGYISLVEILACNVELDFHFEPRTIEALEAEQIEAKRLASQSSQAEAEPLHPLQTPCPYEVGDRVTHAGFPFWVSKIEIWKGIIILTATREGGTSGISGGHTELKPTATTAALIAARKIAKDQMLGKPYQAPDHPKVRHETHAILIPYISGTIAAMLSVDTQVTHWKLKIEVYGSNGGTAIEIAEVPHESGVESITQAFEILYREMSEEMAVERTEGRLQAMESGL
jgi:hypothetical protein